MIETNDLIEFSGFITFYKFSNEETGYHIALFKIDDNKQERTITIVGYFPYYNKDEALDIKVKSINHPKYGLQFEVVEIFKRLPTTMSGIVKFLSSSSFKGIGKKKAQAIFDVYKEETLDKLINDPIAYEKLIENNVINEEQANVIKEQLKNFDFKSNAYQIMLRYGFSLKNIMKAEAVYNENLNDVIKNNPYQLINDIEGIGFKTIDKLATNMNIEKDDPRRVKAAILYVILEICNSKGNTYVTLDEIETGLNRLIKIENEKFTTYLNELINNNLVIFDNKKYYHKKYYDSEVSIAKHLKTYVKRNINKDRLDKLFNDLIMQIQEDDGITYSSEQLEAIYNVLSNGVSIITGGPGTGKTTILNALIKMFKMLYGQDVHISLCAPTGRASKRMAILSHNMACTIHRLLKWDLHSNTFIYNENNRLKTDIIIVDEFSMVDTLLFDSLLKGVKDVSQIVLIGDDGQLPSVGAGNVLYDLLHVDYISVNKLNHIYRQSEGSNIVDLAYHVRNSTLDENFTFNKDVRFFKLQSIYADKIVIKLLSEAFEKDLTFDDIQVIVPMYSGIAGIDNINYAIQKWYNPPSEHKNEIRVGHQIIREGDRVLQLKNQVEDDVYNGDIGIVQEIDLEEEEIYVEFDSGIVIYPKQLHSNLTLAYAISIHKAQGSEFNYVIMCIFNEFYPLLNKQLIYTAISRAKTKLFILGDYRTFLYKSRLENKDLRKTTLIERCKEIF